MNKKIMAFDGIGGAQWSINYPSKKKTMIGQPGFAQQILQNNLNNWKS